MKRRIRIENTSIEYMLKKSPRSRAVRLIVKTGGEMVVTAPLRVSERLIERFIFEKAEWILEKLEYFKTLPESPPRSTRKEYLEWKEEARALAYKRLRHFNAFYGFAYGSVSVKNQKTCWGSCSKKRNLNFNYKIIHLPPALTDYIIVHELCHLSELNHSPRFWNLVMHTIPDWKERRKVLKKLQRGIV